MSNVQSEKNAICRIIKDLCERFGAPYSKGKFIFRGEPDASYPSVSSGLLRKIKEMKGRRAEESFDSERMMRHLASRAAPYVGGNVVGREFETIAAMQHYGAATPLIDFTEDWRVALYFACERNESKDGRIIHLTKKRAKERYDLTLQIPESHDHDTSGRLAGRQVDQRSVLVWAKAGEFITSAPSDATCLPKKLKPHLLAWLRSQGLSEDVIYNDLHHHISQTNEVGEASTALILAEALLEQCDWRPAIRILKCALGITRCPDRSIALIEQRGSAYFMLAQAYEGVDQNGEALKYYRHSASRLQSKENGVEVRLRAEKCSRSAGEIECENEFRSEIDGLW